MALKEKVIRKGFLIKKRYSYEQDVLHGKKALKQHRKNTLKVSVDGTDMDADLNSINYMSTVLALANAEFINAIADGMAVDEARDLVFNQIVPWKTADNEVKDATIFFIKDTVKAAMAKTAQLVGAK